MAILSNQGRTIPELPALSAANIGNNDVLLIQNIATNSTKKTTVSDFSTKTATLLASTNYLNFGGPNNSYTGSLRSVESDIYTVPDQGIPNVLKRLYVTDYSIFGGSVVFTGGINFTNLNVNGTLFASNIELYNGTIDGATLGHTLPCTVSGSLSGIVYGNVTSKSGTSTFNIVNINDTLSCNAVSFAGGTIDNISLGSQSDCSLTGSVKATVQQTYKEVTADGGDITLDFNTYDLIYLTTLVDGITINVNLTQRKQCLLYFNNESGGTGYVWSTTTSNHIRWPTYTGGGVVPADGFKDLYKIVLMGDDILITRLGQSYI